MQNDLISKIEVLNIIHEKYMKFRTESQTPMGEDDVLIDCTKESIAIILKALHDEIKKLKTAYDVEKVVEQIKETGKRVCVSVHCNDECQDCEHGVLMCSLIDIVRNGGKE